LPVPWLEVYASSLASSSGVHGPFFTFALSQHGGRPIPGTFFLMVTDRTRATSTSTNLWCPLMRSPQGGGTSIHIVGLRWDGHGNNMSRWWRRTRRKHELPPPHLTSDGMG
jgi:hypothetical protein